MISTHIKLTEEQYAALKAVSTTDGISINELIRIAVDWWYLSQTGGWFMDSYFKGIKPYFEKNILNFLKKHIKMTNP